jgi:radical SAM protein with 4Fe4S-binding SPASM domain
MKTKLERDIANQMAIVHDLATQSETWTSRPPWLEFSTNNVCNLRCVMCAQADGLPVKVMPNEVARKLLDDVLPTACVVTPSAISEPMLGNIQLVLEKCREHEAYVNLTTNATVLDGKRFRAMADRVAKLNISFDSHVPEVLERIRVRAKFDVVVAHIREILPIARELGVPVAFVFVLMSENAAHLPETVDFLADLGASEAGAQIRVQRLLGGEIGSRAEDLEVHRRYSREEIVGFLDRAAERARARKVRFYVDAEEPYQRIVAPIPDVLRSIPPELLEVVAEAIRRKYPGFCSMAAYYLKVDPDGTVYPCCRQPAELKMGNALETPIWEIWNGEKYREFRRRMFAGDYPEACRGCDVLVGNPHFQALRERAEAAEAQVEIRAVAREAAPPVPAAKR